MTIRTSLVASALGIAAVLLSARNVGADMGRVYVSTGNATVSESAQKAIILHNNEDEVLILGTELHADRRTPILRFIPFPSEPQVSLAPKDVFAQLQAMIAKYKLQYVYAFHSKGGPGMPRTEGVELRLAAKLGAHDLTVIKVTDAAAFRTWVNTYFRRHHMPRHASYPKVEAIVADYVARGIDYFVLDAVDVGVDSRFVDPVAYTFKSASLYYPLKTSNTFGGKGEIELFVISPATLCLPGSGIMPDDSDKAAGSSGGTLGDCLGLKAKASTSAELVPQEQDIQSLYPEAAGFFGKAPVFIQTMRYKGDYKFDNDILVPMPAGVARAIGVSDVEDLEGDTTFGSIFGEDTAICRKKPERGPCKGMFESYYFDAASHSCKTFIWGGCQGSVPFQTRESCEQACVVSLPK